MPRHNPPKMPDDWPAEDSPRLNLALEVACVIIFIILCVLA